MIYIRVLSQHIKPSCVTFLKGLEIIFRVGMAILQYNQTDLIQLDMEGMSQVNNNNPNYNASNLYVSFLDTRGV